MKRSLVSILLAGTAILLACSGCQSSLFHKKSSTPAASVQSVGAGQSSPSAGQPQNPSASSQGNQGSPAGNYMDQGEQWVNYSTLDNLLDVRSPVCSNGSVLIINHDDKDGVVQISDRTIGIPNEKGRLAVMVLGPGESFALRDYGFGSSTLVRFVIVDEHGNQLYYHWTDVEWSVLGRRGSHEIVWDVQRGDPVELPLGPHPTKLPVRSGAGSGTIHLQSHIGPLGSPQSASH